MAPDDPAPTAAPDAAPAEAPDAALTALDVASGDPASGDPAAELRGADLVRAKTSDELAGKLDPQTTAQLAAWFGLPSYTELAERGETGPKESEDDKYWRELRAKIADAVLPAMIERVASKVTSADRLLQLRELAPMTTEVPVLLHDERFSDQVGMASEPRVLELSNEHLSDLNDCAPQAILRDLYRPEADFCEPCTWREPWGTPPPDDRAMVREVMNQRYPMPPWIKPVAEFHEATADMRVWKAKDWGALPIPRPEGD